MFLDFIVLDLEMLFNFLSESFYSEISQLFFGVNSKLSFLKYQLNNLTHYVAIVNFTATLFFYLLIYQHGDIEKNPA